MSANTLRTYVSWTTITIFVGFRSWLEIFPVFINFSVYFTEEENTYGKLLRLDNIDLLGDDDSSWDLMNVR
ncbi:Protein of unknown function [Cotesia congregata]|uniref:Uncharacterized protein n=1 Tax=Cotesia congregata TaxID=51543 RepID=A0A8J2HHP9_COTCN|nr:Protein of unknown function [Cotesia congregata]